jgi:hypothetical protein
MPVRERFIVPPSGTCENRLRAAAAFENPQTLSVLHLIMGQDVSKDTRDKGVAAGLSGQPLGSFQLVERGREPAPAHAADGEVFDYPGLYVSDGAALPSSLAVNTSLTILANAERIAEGVAERYGLRAAA